ncbi:adenylate/guanylate cyclase domain-containing protein [Alphaproteobacteria bacterium]|nr:adenylate/guanylate cyclase domain-containing protein [Alphaproteobacteria bacterium]
MSDDNIIRKIAVIFVTDVVGFSKLMEKNEEQTLRSFRACKEILDNLFLEHGGRIFNTAGDSVLAEFQSAVSAVICASEFQKLVKQRNATQDNEDAQMRFRVGINMGDVIVEDQNLYGDGVNVAARLEALAQPDSVCLSKGVHDFVSQKVDLSFIDIGDQQVKNTMVRAYDMMLEGTSDRANQQNETKTDTEQSLSKPPTIAVLPFVNQSNDPDQDYFADGISEDIIANLSSWRTFPVIARNTSFTYKDSNLKSSMIAQEMGARYLVTGSIRKGANKVRITANLIDAIDEQQIWSQRWDRPLDDIFEVQDEVSQSVAVLIVPALKGKEHSRGSLSKKTNDLSAWDLYLQALSLYNGSEIKYPEIAIKCEAAVELDPNFCEAYTLQCRALTVWIFNHMEPEKRAEHEQLFHRLAQKAYDINSSNPEAVIMLSRSFNLRGDYEKRVEFAQLAHELNPSNSAANNDLAMAVSSFGRFDESLKYLQKAIELDPSNRSEYESFLPFIYLGMKDIENAKRWVTLFRDKGGNARWYGFLAALEAHLGNMEAAEQALSVYLEKRPEIKTLRDYEKVVPTIAKDFIMSGLQKAGMPD